jgi:hypothetical protein
MRSTMTPQKVRNAMVEVGWAYRPQTKAAQRAGIERASWWHRAYLVAFHL